MQLMNARRRVRASFKRSLSALKSPARVFRLVRPQPNHASTERPPSPVPSPRPLSPSEAERQRLMDGVLSALRQLTSRVT